MRADNIESSEDLVPPLAPRKMTHALADDYLRWLAHGHTQGYVCQELGISRFAIYRWRKKHEDFAEKEAAIKKTRDEAVEDSLFAQALAGNVHACMFWLKNRASERWRDVQRTEHSVEPANLAELVAKVASPTSVETVDERFVSRN